MDTSFDKGKWDFFIAHAGPDREVAETLYDRLLEKSRVFLDARSLLLGDDWDRELSEAQRNSLVTVVLISSNTEEGYYQREEIAAAIALARTTDKHRVVPVYLNGEAAASNSVPYGLRLKHGITLTSKFQIGNLADALLNLLDQVRGTNLKKGHKRTRQPTAKTATSWTIAVFNFRNWGEAVEKEKLGQRFSGFILNSLLEMQLNTKQMNEEPQYLPSRSSMGEPDLRKYADLIPWIAVDGFVANDKEGTIDASIRVTSVDRDC